MTEFFLDVTAVVVGIAVYSRIRSWLRSRRYYANYNSDPWNNW